MANKTYIYCGSNDMSIMKLCLSAVMPSQFEMVTLLLGHPVLETYWAYRPWWLLLKCNL